MSTVLQQELSRLTAAEKLLLVEELWDDLAQQVGIENLVISDSQKTELDRRYEEFLKNPEEGSSWETVKERLLSR